MNNKLVVGNDAPIFFYCGNEGLIDLFYSNFGFVTDTLPTSIKGLVLFAEHRYYGKLMPFGDQSFPLDHVKFLTVDQAMMGYVKFIKFIKASDAKYKNSPVIAFGGSYGGMLSTWMQMKYPHIIAGAHASSAPILFVQFHLMPIIIWQLEHTETLSKIVTQQ